MFDEADSTRGIEGTVHFALAERYKETGGKNESDEG